MLDCVLIDTAEEEEGGGGDEDVMMKKKEEEEEEEEEEQEEQEQEQEEEDGKERITGSHMICPRAATPRPSPVTPCVIFLPTV